MKSSNNIIKLLLLHAFFFCGIAVFSQSYPTGGYQGGGHGNVSYVLWTGAVDEDWADPDNWCPAVVPDEDREVKIPADAAVMPEVKSMGLSCKSLTLENGAEVTIKDGFTLTVDGKEIE